MKVRMTPFLQILLALATDKWATSAGKAMTMSSSLTGYLFFDWAVVDVQVMRRKKRKMRAGRWERNGDDGLGGRTTKEIMLGDERCCGVEAPICTV